MKDTVGLGFLPRRSSGHLDAGVVSPGRRDALARRREFGGEFGSEVWIAITLVLYGLFLYLYVHNFRKYRSLFIIHVL